MSSPRKNKCMHTHTHTHTYLIHSSYRSMRRQNDGNLPRGCPRDVEFEVNFCEGKTVHVCVCVCVCVCVYTYKCIERDREKREIDVCRGKINIGGRYI